MTGVNGDNLHPRLQRFIAEEATKLGERPTVKSALSFAVSSLYPVTNLGQVLNHDSCSWGGALHNAPRENVVIVPVEAKLLARQFLQMAFGRLRSFGLEFLLDAKVAPIDFLPVALPEELTVGSHGWMIQAKVNAHNFASGPKLRLRESDNDVQPERTLAVNKVRRSSREAEVTLGVFRDGEANIEPVAWTGGEIHLLLEPVYPVGVDVVASGTKVGTRLASLPFRLLMSKRRLKGFSSFNSRLNDKVANEVGATGLDGIVGRVVKPNAVLLVMLPSMLADIVKGISKVVQHFEQAASLFCVSSQPETNRSIHVNSIPYIGRYCKYKKGGSALSAVA